MPSATCARAGASGRKVNLQTITPPQQKHEPPRARWRLPWWLTALLLLLFSGLWYLPAIGTDYGKNSDYSKQSTVPGYLIHQNIRGFSLPGQGFPGGEDFNQRWEWLTAGNLLLDKQPPLWRYDARDGGRPLLALSSAPIFYPPSLIYYLDQGNGLFSAFHLWIALCGICLLLTKLKEKLKLAVGIGLVGAALLLMPGLRPDFLAAVSWLPLALWLPLSTRRYVKLLALTLVLGLISLAVGLPTSLMFCAVVCLWLVLVESYRGGWQALVIARAVMLAAIVLGSGLLLAGPQLFPRLVYQAEPYQIPPDISQVRLLAPAGVKLIDTNRQSETEVRYQVALPVSAKNNRLKIQLIVPERYDEGWQAQFSTAVEPKKFSDGKLERTPEGWRLLTLEPAENAGTITVRMRYNPLSFTLGLYAAFLVLASEAMVLLVLGWVRFYREDERDHPLRRILKNSVTPMFAQLSGKVIDFGFAFISLRLLGPEGNGRYTVAVTIWLFFNSISDFGLETLVTREIARNRNPENANRYFSTMLVTRFALSTLSLPLALLWAGGLSLSGQLATDAIWATALLMLGMLPGAISGSLAAVFRGYEKFEYLAAIQILGSIIRVPLGLGALLIGWGVIGLAGTSIAVNLVALASLWSIFSREIMRPNVRKGFQRSLIPGLLKASFPLMLNGFLISIMFKSDVFLLLPFRGETEVGLYNSAYKFIDALLIFPSAITLALFPIFSNYSANAQDNMLRAYREGLRILTIIGLPISVGTLFVAHDLIGVAFGDKFLPGGALALQILIWFLPFSYINGVTQYVLIALDKQRLITWAVLITAACNITLNLALIPFFGYIAASAMTIGTELILLIIYYIIMRRTVAPIPLWQTLARPGAASLLMLAVLLTITVGLGIWNFFLTVIVGLIVYPVGLVLFRGVTSEDLRYLRKVIRK